MVLVTGGNGFLGSYLVRVLVGRGEHVRVLHRPTSDLTLLEDVHDDVEFVKGDILDSHSLQSAMKGVHQVVHVAAVVSFDPAKKEQLYQVNVQGAANVVNSALAADVQQLVHVSSVAAIGDTPNNGMIDESARWEREKARSHYSISKFLAEQEAWRAHAEGLPTLIVNPSVIMGAGNWNTGTAALFKRMDEGFPFYTNGVNGFVDVRDVAEATVMLMEHEATGERYILSADNLSFQQVLVQIADELGVARPFLKASPFISALALPFEQLKTWFTGDEPMITSETIASSSMKVAYNNRNVQSAIGYHFRPVRETIHETAAIYLSLKNQGEIRPATLPV